VVPYGPQGQAVGVAQSVDSAVDARCERRLVCRALCFCSGISDRINRAPGCYSCQDMYMTCCNGTCVDLTSDRNNCGICGKQIAANLNCCNGFPTDLQTDPLNCGRCFHSYGRGLEDYVVGSDVDRRCCRGVCRDVAKDNFNCGACGNVCPPGTVCFLGNCTSAPTY